MHFSKYQALGNDYIVVSAKQSNGLLNEQNIQKICHRNFGVGSDGILVDTSDRDKKSFSLQIWNPDGSEAEKSGNGLRIFARYLWDKKSVSIEPFTVHTKGGDVSCTVLEDGAKVSVEMGRIKFLGQNFPDKLKIEDKEFSYCFADIGNPHCVIRRERVSEEEAKIYGAKIEVDKRFPNRTNVQFMEILDNHNIKIEIWERGAGYTLASGSSSSAAAAVAVRLGVCQTPVTVHMPGGSLSIDISDEFAVTMKGPVAKVCEGEIAKELF